MERFVIVILFCIFGGIMIIKVFEALYGDYKRQQKRKFLIEQQHRVLQQITQSNDQGIESLQTQLTELQRLNEKNNAYAQQQIFEMQRSTDEVIALADRIVDVALSTQQKTMALLDMLEPDASLDTAKQQITAILKMDNHTIENYLEDLEKEKQKRQRLMQRPQQPRREERER